MSEEPNVRTRLGTLAEILNEFARLMDEQAEFHSGQRMDLGNSVVRQAAAQAQRRLKRLDLAGERWLREMEKTMLVEIARASHLASSIITEAATEAWPDLERAVERARTVIRQAAVRDPGLFTPTNFAPDTIREAAVAPFAAALADAAVDWREIDPDCFAAIAQNGIPMAIVAWGRDDGRRWLAQVGGIGVGFHENPALAADHAAAAHALWFGGRDEAAAM